MKEIIGFTRNNDWLRRRLFSERLNSLPVQKLQLNFRGCPQF